MSFADLDRLACFPLDGASLDRLDKPVASQGLGFQMQHRVPSCLQQLFYHTRASLAWAQEEYNIPQGQPTPLKQVIFVHNKNKQGNALQLLAGRAGDAVQSGPAISGWEP